ncbi:putative Methyltransferase MT-A70 family protein [Paratrimastix pyriformis]|uniref:Methyltransferase MT-A70 family protein n=1 Tax=Paratrimastix pyriformis TaxID=342808 RepID=A0ABQ8UEA5_9EUKA|nr:putative Methyltransferase MT-A70 family protein [Paratrimastix pyriformis]
MRAPSALEPPSRWPGNPRGKKSRNPPFPVQGPSSQRHNDYCLHFVETGERPQNFIRDTRASERFEEYPKLRELIQRKDALIAAHHTAPAHLRCDLKSFPLAEALGSKFDVILVDPPWEEYYRLGRASSYWTLEEMMSLRVDTIAETPSFLFLWVGNAAGLEQGRILMRQWGFRRCEDIVWAKTNKGPRTNPGGEHDGESFFQHTKEHCLVGLKGTVRRSVDGHLVHTNIDTDVIVEEELQGTRKPEELYQIIERFCNGRRRLELFGEDHNIRPGWVTVGNQITTTNFNREAYLATFAVSHLIPATAEVENLRPKSPVIKPRGGTLAAPATLAAPTPAAPTPETAANLLGLFNPQLLHPTAPATAAPAPSAAAALLLGGANANLLAALSAPSPNPAAANMQALLATMGAGGRAATAPATAPANLLAALQPQTTNPLVAALTGGASATNPLLAALTAQTAGSATTNQLLAAAATQQNLLAAALAAPPGTTNVLAALGGGGGSNLFGALGMMGGGEGGAAGAQQMLGALLGNLGRTNPS